MEFGDYFIYACLGCLSLFIFALLVRWMLDIPRRNKHMEAQTRLLTLMAKNQGIEGEKIDQIVSDVIKDEQEEQ